MLSRLAGVTLSVVEWGEPAGEIPSVVCEGSVAEMVEPM
jgi:hypothetical protein